jgi:hypothetical protein
MRTAVASRITMHAVRVRGTKLLHTQMLGLFALLLAGGYAVAQAPAAAPSPPPVGQNFGPYNDVFLDGGMGVLRPLSPENVLLQAGKPFSMAGWINPARIKHGRVVIASIGSASESECRCLVLENGMPGLFVGPRNGVVSGTALLPGQWQAVAATYDGSLVHLYVNGREVGSGQLSSSEVTPSLQLAPATRGVLSTQHFGGSLAKFALVDHALSAQEVEQRFAVQPAFELIAFTHVSVGWRWQERQWIGMQAPQDPWTLPKANAAPGKPVAQPVATGRRALTPADVGNAWTLTDWRMIPAPQLAVGTDGTKLSQPGFDDAQWYLATVPGTVLTTLVNRGVYPDPAYGLNNMAIPESLARQQYWYRTSFEVPASESGRQLSLTFKGINYAAVVWLNGVRVGDIRGAFIRGQFDVTRLLHLGSRNALAVNILPPPHPGIPQEESIIAGPGENGGSLAIDGPTFVATEGWDWIPGVRDRNVGIWQDVELTASGSILIGDPQILTRLPLPRTDEADVSINVPVVSQFHEAHAARIKASFEGVAVGQDVTLSPGASTVSFDPAHFPQLVVHAPRLWWPNGYGAANLYHLTLTVHDGAGVSDSRSLRFGMRQFNYEISLFDAAGELRRVNLDLTQATLHGERVVDVSHEGIKESPLGFAASLTLVGEKSSAVTPGAHASITPHLVLIVNGVPIAARGGNWGMDDFMKRIGRDRLEPYFKLHKEANLNIIRNWMGQNTEDVFYDLADEYGMLVLNDFWDSTQGFQVEVQDPQLFLSNARDVILRYRNHPSIVAWLGRNEGVPQPIINEGLADLASENDGTRYYNGSSNLINLAGSGPYAYRPLAEYYTRWGQGFAVEIGAPGLSTLESLNASIPESDRWPLSDTLAYHDWHFGGNGNVKPFMDALAARFGAATSLSDFERKAQMMNYEIYRGLFEGFYSGLWTRNSARLLWMTQPAWPSNTWSIYSSDYDTPGAFYGVKKANEPIHPILNLPDFRLAVVNVTQSASGPLQLRSRILSLDNQLLATRSDPIDAAANDVTWLPAIDVAKFTADGRMVLVELLLSDAEGKVVSRNLYWQGRNDASYQQLNDLAVQPVMIHAVGAAQGSERVVTVTLDNQGSQAALNTKLTLLDDKGERILPALYSDNYVSLLPGELREVVIRYTAQSNIRDANVAVRGWNVRPTAARVSSAH